MNIKGGMKRVLSAMAVACLTGVCGLSGVHAQEVIPDFYRDPGLQPNRGFVNQSFNEHIDPFTGGLQQHYVDLHIPGQGGFDLSVVRSYNSASVEPTNPAAHEGLAGVGWTVHFGRVLKTKNTNICLNTNALSVVDNPTVELPDGSRQTLVFTGATSPLMLTAQRWKAECYGAGAGLSVYAPDGTRYDMTQMVNVGTSVAPVYAWFTTKITDRNNNTATISYASNASPEITGVSTSDGRTVSFTYLDSGLATRRINTITAAGQTYTYGYQAITNVAGKYQLTSVTRPHGTKWSYSYNDNLNASAGSYVMRQTTFPEGGTITYGYDWVYFDAQANPSFRTTVVSTKNTSTGGSWSFRYTPGSPSTYDITEVTTPAGKITYKHVGPNYSSTGTVWMVGLLMSKTIGSDQTETYSWDKQKIGSEDNLRPGQFVLKKDIGEVNAPVLSSVQINRNGATYSTTYSSFDTYGNPATVVESGPNGGSRSTTLTYNNDTTKWIVKQVKDESYSGSSISRTFDANGNLKSITVDGVTTSHDYDAQGNLNWTRFPRSLTHNYSNYKLGIARTESQPEGVTLLRDVDDAGNVTSETNGEGRKTSYGYDYLNRLTSIGYPAGNGVTISYTSTSKTATRGGLTESTQYDSFGRLSSVTLGGITRTYRFDDFGRKTYESDPGGGGGANYGYDILGRLTSVSYADGKSRGTSFGAATATVRDENNKYTTYTYRGYGNPDQQLLMNVAAPESSANVAIERNNKGLVSSVTQGGFKRSYDYYSGQNYYLRIVTDPETGTTTYGRDDAGNMTSRSVGSSGTSNFAYDGQNRLYTATYPGTAPSVTNTYYKTGKLKTVTSSVATRSYDYDANSNLTKETVAVDGYSLAIGYGYNSNDQLSSITYPQSNRTVNFSPDTLGRPTQVSGYVSSVGYWPSGQVKTINYANGTISSYDQNARLWPQSFKTTYASNTYVNSSYGYDGVGNLTSISDTVDTSYNRTMLYDGINRLTTASGPWGSGTIGYDGAGNIKSQALGSYSLSYTYNSGTNKLDSVSGSKSTSFGYDAYGNVTSAWGKTFAYNDALNLTCVSCADTANKVEYTYDGRNQRLIVSKAGVKTYELYSSHGHLLAEYTPSLASKLVEYMYLGGKRIAQRESDTTKDTTTTLVVSASTVLVGQQVTLTATVSGTSPTGTVTFKDGASTLGTGSLDAAGKATLTTSFSATGAHNLTASYGGNTNNNASTTASPVSVTVNAPIKTTVSLLVLPSPAGVNQTVTLTAIINGGSSPTGTVVFKDGSTTLATLTLNGTNNVTASTSFTTTGVHSLTATYSGDGANAGSTGSASLTINTQATSSTTLSANPSPAGINQPVSLRATVRGVNPTGSVTFKDGTTTLGSANLASGVATFTTTFTTTGAHNLTAVYAGDTNNTGSTSNTNSLTINTLATSSTLVVLNPNPAAVGQTLVMTATVTGMSPTGNVTFKADGIALAVAALNGGQAVYSVPIDSAGANLISATYSGDTNNAASTSPAVVFKAVDKVSSSTALTVTPSVVYAGQSVTLKATVSGSTPSGTVTFSDGSTALGTATLAAGVATTTVSFASTGSKSITASYAGDAFNNTSQSSVSTVTVNANQPTSTTLATDKAVVGKGETATFTATVPASGATGTVKFLMDAVLVAEVPLNNGKAVWQKTFTDNGRFKVEANYSGAVGYAPSSATMIYQRVYNANVVITPALGGSPNTFNLNVAGPYTTGNIWFVDQALNLTILSGSLNAGAYSAQYIYGASLYGMRAINTIVSVNEPEGVFTFSTPALAHVVGVAFRTTPATQAVVGDDYWVRLNLSNQTSSLAVTGGRVDIVNGSTVVASFPADSAHNCLEYIGSNLAQMSGTFCGSIKATQGMPKALQVKYYAPGLDAPAVTNVFNITVQTKTTTSLTVTPNPSRQGASVTMTATVVGNAPTGTASFKVGANIVGSATVVNGQAVLVKPVSVVGSNMTTVQASYSGDSANAYSQSNTVSLMVN